MTPEIAIQKTGQSHEGGGILNAPQFRLLGLYATKIDVHGAVHRGGVDDSFSSIELQFDVKDIEGDPDIESPEVDSIFMGFTRSQWFAFRAFVDSEIERLGVT